MGASQGAAGAVDGRAIVGLASNPRIGEWSMGGETVYENKDWTTRWQGITAAHDHYFMTNNAFDNNVWDDEEHEGILRLNHDFSTPAVMALRSPWPNKHLGDLSYDPVGRILYVPVEGEGSIWRAHVSSAGSLTSVSEEKYLGGAPNATPQGEWNIPWCGFNPVDRLLYSCRYDEDGGVRHLYAYDQNRNYAVTKVFTFPYMLKNINGGTISPHGNLYLSSDYSKEVVAYRIGKTRLTYWGRYQLNASDLEVEGITMGPPLNYVQTGRNRLHVGCLDVDDNLTTDDLYLKHISVPDPATV